MKQLAKLSLIVFAAIGLALAGCDKDNPTKPSLAGVFVGEQKAMGNGTAQSWVSWDDNGNPNAIGVTFTEGALSNLPSGQFGATYDLVLPPQAAATPFNHIRFDWNPEGHDPAPIYGHPHFDIHFYMISRQERATIAAGPDFTPVEPQYIPRDYGVDFPFAVPDMGVHWGDSTAAEWHGHHFDKTLIYGFYKGKMIFVEPMITKAFLETKPNVTEAIKQPAAYQKTNMHYPMQYSVKFDAGKKEYSITLEGLAMGRSERR